MKHDLGIIDYNNDVSLDNLETIDFNNDTKMTDLTDTDTIAAKKIIEKYRNLKRKGEPIEYSEPNIKSKSRNNDIMFIKQIPMHLRDRLKKINKLRKTDEVKFIKQLSFHPRHRLKRKRREQLDNYNELSKKSKNDAAVFMKQDPIHPKGSLRKLEAIDEKIKLIKQVPSHPWDRLQRIDRKLKHPRNRMKNIED